tara:strand:- start:182 stop:1171 length:990 start_codon:yes stop_codon:yes gene_type:complete
MSKGNDLKVHFPRKGQGDRCRSQAQKFYKLSEINTRERYENLEWAEQSARQSIMYDYTNFQNWELLLKLKLELGDESGIFSLLEDLLAVLGKDMELISQLKQISITSSCLDLFYSILRREPLNADIWWKGIENGEYNLEKFEQRCKKMDFRDRRSNVIFGRRLERVRKNGHDVLFSELMPYLLAHRPDNFELWIELGNHHESLNQLKEAWMCYEQVLHFKPNDQNKNRLSNIITSNFDKLTDFIPQKNDIMSFQQKLEKLAKGIRNNVEEVEELGFGHEIINPLEEKLIILLNNQEFQEAFFLSRGLLSEGNDWAKKYFEHSKEGLLND